MQTIYYDLRDTKGQQKEIEEKISAAAKILREGGLVGIPTETVYGLAANGLDPVAVKRIFEAKGRPQDNPLILHVPDAGWLERCCVDVPETAYALAEKFWPGPLTIVLRAKDTVPEIVRAGGETVALRCPDHPMTLELLKKAKLPLAAPSANPSGAESPKTARQVMDYFDGKIAAVIDGGPCGIGTESTIIDMSSAPYKILRRGALSEESIRSALADRLTVIGITGGTGCGKTTALRQLEKKGAMIIDCDALYHGMLETNAEMLNEIDRVFPGSVTDGKLDRKALGAVVFSNEAALEDLNAITHHYIGLEVQRLLEDRAMQGGTLAAIDAIALIESGLGERCRAVIGVIADKTTRIERIMKRDGISYEYAMMRVNAQYPNEYFEAKCKYILRNDGNEKDFEKECNKLFKEVLKNG